MRWQKYVGAGIDLFLVCVLGKLLSWLLDKEVSMAGYAMMIAVAALLAAHNRD